MKSGKHIPMMLDGLVALVLCSLVGDSSALLGRSFAIDNVDPVQQLSIVDGEHVMELLEGVAMNYEKLMHFLLKEHPTLLELSNDQRKELVNQRRDVVLQRENVTNKYLKKLFPDRNANATLLKLKPNTSDLLRGLERKASESNLQGLSVEDSEKLLEGSENIATTQELLVTKYLKKNPKRLKLKPKEQAQLLDTREVVVKERMKISLEYLKKVWNTTQDDGDKSQPSPDPTTPVTATTPAPSVPATTPTICKIIEYNNRPING